MLCVRYGYSFGLLGIGDGTSVVSTILFAAVFCPLIPLSLLKMEPERAAPVIRLAAVLCAAGLGALALPGRSLLYVSSVLLAAGSALLTSVLFLIYNYALDRRGQIAGITLFLAAKPVFSAFVVFFADHIGFTWYLAAAFAVAGRYLYLRPVSHRARGPRQPPRTGGARPPVWTLLIVFALYTAFRL